MNTDTEERTLEDVAREALDFFEFTERGEGDDAETIVTLTDERPQWVQDLVYDGHGHGAMLPDDWRYDAIRAAVEYIADTGDEDGHEFADGHADIYTGARIAWLASDMGRADYCDQAVEEGLIGAEAGIVERLGVGQYMEALEVFGSVLGSLQERLEAEEDENEE